MREIPTHAKSKELITGKFRGMRANDVVNLLHWATRVLSWKDDISTTEGCMMGDIICMINSMSDWNKRMIYFPSKSSFSFT